VSFAIQICPSSGVVMSNTSIMLNLDVVALIAGSFTDIILIFASLVILFGKFVSHSVEFIPSEPILIVFRASQVEPLFIE
jgi:hypothetical protein